MEAVYINLGVYTQRVFCYGGGKITGTVKVKSSPQNRPIARRVCLFDERSKTLLATTWSDAETGAYDFRCLNRTRPYTVIAYDYEHNYRAEIADNLTPEPMEPLP